MKRGPIEFIGSASRRWLSPVTQALAGSFALKLFSAFFALLASLTLARLLGAEGYGAYAFALAWAMLLTVPATLGMDRLVVRNVAAHRAHDEWALARGMIRRANQWVLIAGGLMVAGAAIVGWLTLEGAVRVTFITGLALVPVLALGRVRRAALQGLDRVVVAQVPELLLIYLLLLAFVVVAQLADVLSAAVAMQAHVLAAVVSLLVGMALLARNRPAELDSVAPQFNSRAWLRAAIPLTLLSGIMIINGRTDVVMVGWLAGIPAAGTYDVASKVSDLVAFLLTALNHAAAPAFARLHALGQRAELQALMVRQTRLVLLGTLPLAAGLLFFGGYVLGVFGSEFTAGRTALSILVLGQIINVAAGPVGLLLMMSGHEKLVAIGFGTGAALNLLLNYLLIPIWGIAGAAAATAGSMVVWNAVLVAFVVWKLDIRPWSKTGSG